MNDDTRTPTHDTDPAPPTAPDHDAPEPSIRQVIDRVEWLGTGLAEVLREHRADTARSDAALAEAIDLARQCLEQVSQARHAIAVVADDVLERRGALDRVAERIDRLHAHGCALGQTMHGRGNGHRED